MRDVHPDTLAALGRSPLYPIIIVYVDWPGAPVRVHSNVGTLSWDSQSWHGVGNFGDIQLPEESDAASFPATLSLLGVPVDSDPVMTASIKEREVIVWFGVVTERAGTTLIGEPFQTFYGTMDVLRDRLSAEDGRLRRDLLLEVSPGPGQRAFAEVYHSDEDQKRTYPSDTGFRLLQFADANALKLTWPE